MPKVNLRQAFVDSPPIPQDKPKVDYFDNQLTGFLLEVRSSGTCTYYLRYRDKGSRIKQLRIGKTDSMTVEQARERARALKSNVLMGFDPLEHVQKIKKIPTFKEFARDQYIPYAQTYKRSWEYDKTFIEKRMLRIWGQKKMNDIKTGDLLEFQNTLVQQGLKPGTVNRIMALVKHIFNLAERWEVIEKAPTRYISRIEDNSTKEKKEEWDRLIVAISRPT